MGTNIDFYMEIDEDAKVITKIVLNKMNKYDNVVTAYAGDTPMWTHKFYSNSFNQFMVWAEQFENIEILDIGDFDQGYPDLNDYKHPLSFFTWRRFTIHGVRWKHENTDKVTDPEAKKIYTIGLFKTKSGVIAATAYDYDLIPRWTKYFYNFSFREFREWVAQFPRVLFLEVYGPDKEVPNLPDYKL